MISKKMESTLNKQVELEAYASFLYLSMASWCEQEGMEGAAKFMHQQSAEEREHMLRIFHYINEVDGHAITPAIKQPPKTFKSINLLLQQVYQHEQKVTKAIHKIVELCYKEDDYTTLNFMQWYIDEQREEEATMRSILDKVKLIGEGAQKLYFIDKELDKFNANAEEESAAEAED